MVINSLSFYQNVLTYYSLLRDSFARYRILGCLAFLEHFTYISWLPFGLQCFWWEICLQPYERSPLYVISFFLSYCLQDSLFTFDFWNLIIMCLGMSLWGHLTWSLLSCLDIYIHVFHQVSEVFSPFVQILSLSSSGTTMVCGGPLGLRLAFLSLSLCLLFFNLVLSVPHTEIGNSIILSSSSTILFLKESLLKSASWNLSFQLFSIFLLQSFFLFFF